MKRFRIVALLTATVAFALDACPAESGIVQPAGR